VQSLFRDQGPGGDTRAVRVQHDRTGNLPSFPAIFPDQMASIVRNAEDGNRELVHARWGMPGPVQYGGAPVTNIRNVSSPAIAIRDDEGENLAADRTVRLKAIQVMEGSEGKGGVVVNVNQTSNVASITPGYVIRLRASRAEGAPMIEHDRAE
jgi:hypothetical protein